MVFLDTNIVSKFMRGRDAALTARLNWAKQSGERLSISVIVLQEMEYGVLKSPDPQRTRAKVDAFLVGIEEIVPFDADEGMSLATIRKQLVPIGKMIGPLDALIAAQAISRGALLVTNNTSEFSRVPGLRWEDWTQA
jgi:tRNA(fMet)-specific endonuclease VapC